MLIKEIKTGDERYTVGHPVNVADDAVVDKINYFKEGGYYEKGQFYNGPSYVVYIGEVKRLIIPEKDVKRIELDRTEEVLAANEEKNTGKKVKKVGNKAQVKTDLPEDEARKMVEVGHDTFVKLLSEAQEE